ncbi:MAG: NAD(P)-binding domain-containing protein [Proteobacteria bacterium]|nr:NAD(P)-binding domain-containing protein [Pseudomonadota bacterium]
MLERHDTVVIGAGQAGLAMSYWLRDAGREHVLLERARAAERWRSERWDSLHFQFTNRYLRLPGHEYRGPEPENFPHCREVLQYLDEYRSLVAPPLEEGVAARALEQDSVSGRFRVVTDGRTLEARRVVIATGPFQRPRVPACAAAVPERVWQLPATRYRHPAALPPGTVLIVGSGSSGCQIADELLDHGRDVVLAVGRHRRIPHRYRGRLMLDWLADLGVLDLPIDRFPGGQPPPPILITGVNGGHDLNARTLAARGARLAGTLRGIESGQAHFDDDALARLAEADQSATDACRRVDALITARGLAAPAADPEPALPSAPAVLRSLDLRSVGAILWCTGYDFDFDWVRLPILDAAGRPRQRRGVTDCPGACFLGLHWMETFKSGTVFGVGDDARYLCEHLAALAV